MSLKSSRPIRYQPVSAVATSTFQAEHDQCDAEINASPVQSTLFAEINGTLTAEERADESIIATAVSVTELELTCLDRDHDSVISAQKKITDLPEAQNLGMDRRLFR